MTQKTSVVGRIGQESPEAPADLSEASVRLWEETVRRFAFGSSELPLLESALRALDRAEEARAIVQRDGPVLVTQRTGAVHRHPAVSIELEARREFRIAWKLLGLVDEEGKE